MITWLEITGLILDIMRGLAYVLCVYIGWVLRGSTEIRDLYRILKKILKEEKDKEENKISVK